MALDTTAEMIAPVAAAHRMEAALAVTAWRSWRSVSTAIWLEIRPSAVVS